MTTIFVTQKPCTMAKLFLSYILSQHTLCDAHTMTLDMTRNMSYKMFYDKHMILCDDFRSS